MKEQPAPQISEYYYTLQQLSNSQFIDHYLEGEHKAMFRKIKQFMEIQFQCVYKQPGKVSKDVLDSHYREFYRSCFKQVLGVKFPDLKFALFAILVLFRRAEIVQDLNRVNKNNPIPQNDPRKIAQRCQQYRLNPAKNPISHFIKYMPQILDNYSVFNSLITTIPQNRIKNLFYQHILTKTLPNQPNLQQSLNKLNIAMIDEQTSNFANLLTYKIKVLKQAGAGEFRIGRDLHYGWLYVWQMQEEGVVWVVGVEAVREGRRGGEVVWDQPARMRELGFQVYYEREGRGSEGFYSRLSADKQKIVRTSKIQQEQEIQPFMKKTQPQQSPPNKQSHHQAPPKPNPKKSHPSPSPSPQPQPSPQPSPHLSSQPESPLQIELLPARRNSWTKHYRQDWIEWVFFVVIGVVVLLALGSEIWGY